MHKATFTWQSSAEATYRGRGEINRIDDRMLRVVFTVEPSAAVYAAERVYEMPAVVTPSRLTAVTAAADASMMSITLVRGHRGWYACIRPADCGVIVFDDPRGLAALFVAVEKKE